MTTANAKNCIIFVLLGTLILTYFILFDFVSSTVDSYLDYFPLLKGNIDHSTTLQQCKIPNSDPFDPSLMPFISHPREVLCLRMQPDLTFVDEKGFLSFNKTEMSLLANASV